MSKFAKIYVIKNIGDVLITKDRLEDGTPTMNMRFVLGNRDAYMCGEFPDVALRNAFFESITEQGVEKLIEKGLKAGTFDQPHADIGTKH